MGDTLQRKQVRYSQRCRHELAQVRFGNISTASQGGTVPASAYGRGYGGPGAVAPFPHGWACLRYSNLTEGNIKESGK